MILNEYYSLSNGVKIPKIGFGTWRISNSQAAQAVKDAIGVGYRHIDTAQAYFNESGVAAGVRESGIKRKDIFITTKLAAEIKSYKKAKKAIDSSLKKMKLDYIDMMIIHSPQPWLKFGGENRFFEGNLEAWRALEDAYKAGKLKAIGVSNFQIVDIENILGSCEVEPMVNQILAHISNTPLELIDYCKRRNILVEAYSPLAHGKILDNPIIAQIAKKYSVTIAQLCIRYTLQLGLLPLPKTQTVAHMKINADADFVISDEDIKSLKNIDKIKDYGDAGVMPVFGGKLNLKSALKSVTGTKNKKE